MGCDIGEDERPKPKHCLIKDAYAKRDDTVLSVSRLQPYTDPAGVNFDMNNLNSADSNVVSRTFAYYMRNAITRRNAITGADLDCERIASRASYGAGESDYSFKRVELSLEYQESRRNSVDSQLSLKVSETEIRGKVDSRSNKHKKVNMKGSRRGIISGRVNRNRRASSSSVESQYITDQRIKYHHPYRAEYKARQAYTKVTQMINRQSLTSEDDDHSTNELSTFRIESTESAQNPQPNRNMLVGRDGSHEPEQQPHHHRKQHKQKQKPGYPDPVDIAQLATNRDLGAFLFNSLAVQQALQLDSENDTTPLSSSIEMNAPQMDESQSSDSDGELEAQPPNSRNNHDARQPADTFAHAVSRQSRSHDRYKKGQLVGKPPPSYDDQREMAELLPAKRRDAPTIVPRNEALYMSESEKMERLKKLLMPAN